MGSPGVDSAGRQTSTHKWQYSLIFRITAIVFWGLVVIGLLMSALLMHELRADLEDRYQKESHRIALVLGAFFHQSHYTSVERLKTDLHNLFEKLDLEAIRIQTGERQLWFGNQREGLIEYTIRAPLQRDGPDESAQESHVLVTIYQKSLDEIAAAYRKRLMLLMGITLFVFGIVLRWILQQVLTRPILDMVHTAQAFQKKSTTRFDETRKDEFGFLAHFINEALDRLTGNQQALKAALERAQESEQSLFTEKERAEVTLQSIADAVITTDKRRTIQYLNPVAERLTGWTLEEARGQPLSGILEIKDEINGELLPNTVDRCMRDGMVERRSRNSILVRRDNTEIAVEESAAPIHNRNGDTIGVVLVLQDVEESRTLARQLSHQASHDVLTGLYNRREFEQQLQMAMESTQESGQPFSICYMDLDQFKVVNDTCGHIAGDDLLRQLSSRLQTKVRETDVLARIGGDEFGVLLDHCPIADARRIASEFCLAVQNFHYVWEGKSFDVGVSIGIVEVTGEEQNVTEAMSAADVACYTAKDQGRNRVHIYQPGDRELQRRRGDMQWVTRIRDALKENRFQLFSQAVIPIGKTSGESGYQEILLRMLDENEQTISPVTFLPAAERYKLTSSIDCWVICQSIAWLADQADDGEGTMLAINLSGQSISDKKVLQTVVELVGKTGIAPERLCFEITETAAIANLNKTAVFIRALKNIGCRFALDDFGSGMSSFSYLKTLPVDYIKIDGSYVKDLMTDPLNQSLVEAINQISHAMGMQTVAEFVEDQETLELLARIGVDFAQGFGVSYPHKLELNPARPDNIIAIKDIRSSGP